MTATVPASALQLHAHATVVVDGEAAAGLARAGYYRETWAHKPDWQGLWATRRPLWPAIGPVGSGRAPPAPDPGRSPGRR